MKRVEGIKKVVQRLRNSEKILFITGAGVSAESGIPTFRGKDGWWKNHNPMELASPEGFRRQPEVVWEWYNHRRRIIRNAMPNPAHKAIAEFEYVIPHCLIVTQNVDGLHQEAGSTHVVEVHGSIWRTRCTKHNIVFERDEVDTEKQVPPVCPRCGAILRPDVVWFGEMLPLEPLEKVEDYLQTPPYVDVTFVVGTSALFAYIQQWALYSKRMGALLIDINPEGGPLTATAEYSFREPAGSILPAILRHYKG